VLSEGVPEAELPRMHRGVIEAFRIHAVQTGRIDPELASSLSRTENLRLKADYTGAEIDAGVAKEVVAHAEKFVRTVERVFGLEGRSKDAGVNDVSGRLDRASQHEPSIDPAEPGGGFARRPSIEETQRQAAENWRRNYYDKRNETPGSEQESTDSEQNIIENDERHKRDTGMDFDPER
jgi:hypothetical protein